MIKRHIQGILTILFLSFVSQRNCQVPLTPQTALQSYLNNGDKTYHWELKDSYLVGDVKAYDLLLTSQQWHEFVWTHQLTILVPNEKLFDGALLFITGGGNKKGLPNWKGQDDKFLAELADFATKNKSMVDYYANAESTSLWRSY